ncbi:hypothetical protein N566_14115 [Streptomycetaceae bacterium MP113-05]|nr:hypothetical protein N566_14115 [Streptomycetaceae bacterium MP113-05]
MDKLAVTTWWLEQTAPADLTPSRMLDEASGVRTVRSEVPSPEFSRFLYTAVGGDVAWTDRLGWPRSRWAQFLDRPAVETWVAWLHGTPAGFVELNGHPGGSVEISYFGLLPAFRGRGIGGHLLSYGTARAWDQASRWPEREPTRRVWVHTCSKDGPFALDNYRRRGFRVFDTRVEQEQPQEMPRAWPEG